MIQNSFVNYSLTKTVYLNDFTTLNSINFRLFIILNLLFSYLYQLSFSMRKILYIFILILAFALVFFLFKNTAPKSEYVTMKNGESCMNCHQEKTGFSPFHEPKNIGCVACHLGNAHSETKDSAHFEMVRIPGNLSDADKTCGKCHANQLHNVKHSLMTTNSGIIAVDKYFFNDADSLDAYYHIQDLGFDASDTHLRNLCANCHLGAEKKEMGAISQTSRGGGCNACHLNYEGHDHPATNIQITNEHCFGCHSRSSRISTNYMGYAETLAEELPKDGKHKQFEDGRIYDFVEADVHHELGLLCIDCHSSKEVMGDGKTYVHASDAVKIQCNDCHTKNAKTTTYEKLDGEEKMLFALRKYQHQNKAMISTQKDVFALLNTYLDNENEVHLISKKDNKDFTISKPNEHCTKPAHKDLACNTCHSSWAPKCIGCHNTFNKEKDSLAYDLLAQKPVNEAWNELVAEFGSSELAFGVRESKSHERKIECAVPGMIMSIDHQSFDSAATSLESFYRLYAPNAPHTTTKQVRTCKSCHNNPYALGYGSGDLLYKNEQWLFDAFYENNENDNLPEDAWIEMFKEQNPNKDYSTRTDFRPFNTQEQKNILAVGKCLQCHQGNDSVMEEALEVGIWKVTERKLDVCL